LPHAAGKRPAPAFGSILALVALLWGIWLWFGLPPVDAYRTRKGFFREAAGLASGKPLHAYRYDNYDLPFYLARTVPMLDRREQLELVSGGGEGETFVIASTKDGTALEPLRFRPMLTRTWVDPFQPSRSQSMALYAR
jgi:hypothetical protein